ncbi:MAG TPA: GNAT family N-acetyltransferase [Streptosporangiaceae bacterium]|nr:GNAT family N-acetyltransferase [Streptosporangiaceae bacterium]
MDDNGAIRWRALTVEDGAEWARLLLAVERSYGTEDFVGAEDLVEDLRDPDVDPERGTIAAFSQGSMIAYAGLRPSPTMTGRHEIALYGAVHPSYRGRGLGTRVLAWAEQAALPLHQERHPGRPLALSADCPGGQEDALALFASAGYQQVRWFHFMSRDLTGAVPDRPLAEGVRIAGYAAEFSQAARRVRDEAFGGHGGSAQTTAESWQHFVGHERFRPAFSFVAYLGDGPVGVLIANEYDAFRQATGRRECFVATVGVTGQARGRGIASALLGRSLAAARADGCDIATLYVGADSPTGTLTLYEHAGFTRQRTSVTLIKDLTDQ